jgi:hypothetical protein
MCLISQAELRGVNRLCGKIQEMIEEPGSNLGLFSYTSPLAKELSATILTLDGEVDDHYKTVALRGRLGVIIEIVEKSSDSNKILPYLSTIQELAEEYLTDKSKEKHETILVISHYTRGLLESVSVPEKYRPPIRSKAKNDTLIAKISEMVFVFTRANAHDINFQAYKRHMGQVYTDLTQDLPTAHYPWLTLEMLHLVNQRIEGIYEKHKKECTMGHSKAYVDGLIKTRKRKDPPGTAKEPVLVNSLSTSSSSSSTSSLNDLPPLVSPIKKKKKIPTSTPPT